LVAASSRACRSAALSWTRSTSWRSVGTVEIATTECFLRLLLELGCGRIAGWSRRYLRLEVLEPLRDLDQLGANPFRLDASLADDLEEGLELGLVSAETVRQPVDLRPLLISKLSQRIGGSGDDPGELVWRDADLAVANIAADGDTVRGGHDRVANRLHRVGTCHQAQEE
jgi:hypothetical protein